MVMSLTVEGDTTHPLDQEHTSEKQSQKIAEKVSKNQRQNCASRVMLTSLPAWYELAGDTRTKGGHLWTRHHGK